MSVGIPSPKTEDSKLSFTDKTHVKLMKKEPDGEGEGGGGKKWKLKHADTAFQHNDH